MDADGVQRDLRRGFGGEQLTKDIGYNAGKGFDYISTSHELLNNAFWSATGCYGSFSWPCSTS